MYIIKKTIGKRYLVREEDDNFVTLNLVYDKSVATRFNTLREATAVRDLIINNALEQRNSTTDLVEFDSLEEFLSLTVINE